jgi:hypothetical protein
MLRERVSPLEPATGAENRLEGESLDLEWRLMHAANGCASSTE